MLDRVNADVFTKNQVKASAFSEIQTNGTIQARPSNTNTNTKL